MKNTLGDSVLHYACFEYQLHAVQLFLETPSVDVNQLSDDSNYTPLQILLHAFLFRYKDHPRAEADHFFKSLLSLMGAFLDHDKCDPNVLSQSSPYNDECERSLHMPGMSILHMACSRIFAFLTFGEQYAILSLLLSLIHI